MSAAMAPVSTIAAVNNGDERTSYERRRNALGYSRRQMAELAGVDRASITKLEEGEKVRTTTVVAVETALAAEEKKLGQDLPPEVEDDSAMVEIRVEGNFGVTAVVKGPVRDIDALQRAAEALVAKMQGGQEVD